MHKVIDVKPLDDYTILLTFEDNKRKVFDVKPYMKNFFKQLKDKEYFKNVKVCLDTVQWENGQDFCPDSLYEESVELN